MLGIGEIALCAAVAAGLAGTWVASALGKLRRERAVHDEHVRARRARGAASEAAEEDPLFSPDAIQSAVVEMVSLAGGLWQRHSLDGLSDRPDARMIEAWARSRESFMGGGLELQDQLSVDLLDVVNRAGEAEDRVVARVRVNVRCRHSGPLSGSPAGMLVARHRVHLDERWTLGRNENRWALLSVDGDPLAGPVLTAPLVATRGQDLQRLREESLAELASAERTSGTDAKLAELVPAGEPPALALNDLSVVDGRFLPALIAAALAHLVETWEEATTGSAAPLEELASASAVTSLLHPDAERRLIMRDAVLGSWEPTRLDLQGSPAVEVGLNVTAVRWVAGADGRHVAGNAEQPNPMALRWRLELTESPQAPWRLVESSNPAQSIPGC